MASYQTKSSQCISKIECWNVIGLGHCVSNLLDTFFPGDWQKDKNMYNRKKNSRGHQQSQLSKPSHVTIEKTFQWTK